MQKSEERLAVDAEIKTKISKRGQITIFVIVAIGIILAAVFIYLFFPKIQAQFISVDPNMFIKNCIEDEVKINDIIKQISYRGGSLNPENYILYKDEKISYLCYINEYYKPCVMQQPMLKEHIESEIQNAIKQGADNCFDKLKSNYEAKGYSVNVQKKNINVELVPKNIKITLDYPTTLTKEASSRYENFKIFIDNNLYDLVVISTSILNWEARYGDSETTVYMTYYPDIKVEKWEQGDGTKIYVLTDRNIPENKFKFASRSVAWPPGYGGAPSY